MGAIQFLDRPIMNPLHRSMLVSALTLFLPFIATAQPGSNDPTFNPGDIGNGHGDGFHPYDAYTVGVRTDGRMLIGGEFLTYNGSGPAYLVPLEANGARDAAFQLGTGPDGAVNSVEVLPDGRWMIAGGFQHYDGSPAANVARLLADGALDPDFMAAPGADVFVSRAAVRADGKVVLAGVRYLNPDTFICWVGRLNADGTPDATFTVAAFDTTDGNIIRDLAIAPGGDILLGGHFNRYGGTARSNVLRLNEDGSLDTAFDPGTGFNGDVWKLALRPDGRLLVAGFFTTVQSATHRGLVQLLPDGTVDGTFAIGEGFTLPSQPFTDAQLFSLLLRPDGKVYVGGWYDALDGLPQRGLVRLNTDGSKDGAFDVGAGCPRYILTMAQLTGDRLLIAGTFEEYDRIGTGNIARLLPDGGFDTTFNPCTGFSIFTTGQLNGYSHFGTGVSGFSPLPDGGVIAHGLFGAYNGTPRARLARIGADGALAVGFDPGTGPFNDGAETSVNATAILPDGRVIVGGAFSSFSGIGCGNITRLQPDGAVDPGFDAGTGFNGPVLHLLRQPDGRILVSGMFSTCNGTARPGLARLLADGAVDASFVPPSVPMGPLVLQPDGRVIAAGQVRLESSGALDLTWSVGDGFSGGAVNCALVQPDGKLLVGGGFTVVDGFARGGVVRLDPTGAVDPGFDPGEGSSNPGLPGEVYALALQADGRVLVGGRFTGFDGVARNNIARLLANGELDLSFDPGTGFTTGDPSGDSFPGILALGLQPDGRLLAGGMFTQYNGIGRNRIARVITAGSTCIPSQLTTTGDPVISCGAVNLKLNGTSTIAATEVPGADRYRFRFTNITGQPAYSRNIAWPDRSFTLTKWSTNPLKAGRTYNVVVRASFDNGATWCDWGPSCTVKVSWTPLMAGMDARDMDAAWRDAAELLIRPNPTNGDNIRLISGGLDPELTTITLDITDLFGKRVMSATLPINDGELNSVLSLNSDLSNGMYIAHVTTGSDILFGRFTLER